MIYIYTSTSLEITNNSVYSMISVLQGNDSKNINNYVRDEELLIGGNCDLFATNDNIIHKLSNAIVNSKLKINCVVIHDMCNISDNSLESLINSLLNCDNIERLYLCNLRNIVIKYNGVSAKTICISHDYNNLVVKSDANLIVKIYRPFEYFRFAEIDGKNIQYKVFTDRSLVVDMANYSLSYDDGYGHDDSVVHLCDIQKSYINKDDDFIGSLMYNIRLSMNQEFISKHIDLLNVGKSFFNFNYRSICFDENYVDFSYISKINEESIDKIKNHMQKFKKYRFGCKYGHLDLIFSEDILSNLISSLSNDANVIDDTIHNAIGDYFMCHETPNYIKLYKLNYDDNWVFQRALIGSDGKPLYIAPDVIDEISKGKKLNIEYINFNTQKIVKDSTNNYVISKIFEIFDLDANIITKKSDNLKIHTINHKEMRNYAIYGDCNSFDINTSSNNTLSFGFLKRYLMMINNDNVIFEHQRKKDIIKNNNYEKYASKYKGAFREALYFKCKNSMSGEEIMDSLKGNAFAFNIPSVLNERFQDCLNIAYINSKVVNDDIKDSLKQKVEQSNILFVGYKYGHIPLIIGNSDIDKVNQCIDSLDDSKLDDLVEKLFPGVIEYNKFISTPNYVLGSIRSNSIIYSVGLIIIILLLCIMLLRKNDAVIANKADVVQINVGLMLKEDDDSSISNENNENLSEMISNDKNIDNLVQIDDYNNGDLSAITSIDTNVMNNSDIIDSAIIISNEKNENLSEMISNDKNIDNLVQIDDYNNGDLSKITSIDTNVMNNSDIIDSAII